jgi:hypothetical protein
MICSPLFSENSNTIKLAGIQFRFTQPNNQILGFPALDIQEIPGGRLF